MALDQEDRNLCKSFCPDMFTNGNETHNKFLDLKSHFLGKRIDDDF